MDGFLIINKNKGITSFGVCNKIKKVFNEKHVGHTGTLDPSTTGVLVVAIGKACKTLKLLEEHKKEYKTTILFGMSSDTFDMDGKILNDNKIIVDKEKVLEAIRIVSKYKEQIPPMFSAIKVNGKKMYELARKGESIELKPRKHSDKLITLFTHFSFMKLINLFINSSLIGTFKSLHFW